MQKNLKIFDISGRTALITGAAGLLGHAHAKALLEISGNVILTDVNESELIKTQEVLKKKYPIKKVDIFLMDVTSEKSIRDVSKNIKDLGLRVDILINNAAINPTANSLAGNERNTRLEDYSLNQWNMEINVGLTGAFLCSKEFGTAMAADERGGVILNISSDLSVIAPDQRLYRQTGLEDDLQAVKPISYSVIKTGLLGLTRYLSSYWPEKGVRANTLSPGGVFIDQDAQFVARLEQLIPMGRMANQDEYIGAIQFLCSDASAYMNGQNVVIDGGRSII